MEGPTSQNEYSRYDTEPLPFEHVDQIEQALTWKDFDQDETGTCVYLYRGIEHSTSEWAKDTAHMSHAASYGETAEAIHSRFNEPDKRRLAKLATEFFQGSSPILHTTRDKHLAERLVGQQGVMISYKIPKAWLIKEENRPYLGNVGEAELDFFHSLPQEFVDTIVQKGEMDIIKYDTPTPDQKNSAAAGENVQSSGDDIIIVP